MSNRPRGKATRHEREAAFASRKARELRTLPGLVKLSNPFKHSARKRAFTASVEELTKVAGNPDWVRREAMKVARRVVVPKKQRPQYAAKS